VAVACYWLEPTDQAEVGLRRYAPASGELSPKCPREGGAWGYHGALVVLATVPITWSAERPEGCSHWLAEGDDRYGVPDFAYPAHDDPRWPSRCECGYEFAAGDPWQKWFEQLYQRADNGGLVRLRDAPPGAMWDARFSPWKGPDGRSLVVKCPNGGGDWAIDSRASNCTMPDDSEHRCWVRHGEPPVITVDKDGKTCNAGGGSIQAGDYHGFLRGGAFT
jgi:hypothetical protein